MCVCGHPQPQVTTKPHPVSPESPAPDASREQTWTTRGLAARALRSANEVHLRRGGVRAASLLGAARRPGCPACREFPSCFSTTFWVL